MQQVGYFQPTVIEGVRKDMISDTASTYNKKKLIRKYECTVRWELTVHCIIVWCGGVLERLLVAFPDPFSDPELCGWIRIKWIRCDLVLPGLTDNNVLDFDQS